jgi:CubicO group peptidase (beta-lactamase class C family)
MLANGGALNGTRFVSRKTLDLMAMNHVPVHLFPLRISADPMYGYGFGLGFSVLLDPAAAGRVASAGEFGWSGAAGTHFWIDPVEDVFAIFMTQYMGRLENGEAVQRRSYHPDLRNLVYQALE